jgi:uncharacterized protein
MFSSGALLLPRSLPREAFDAAQTHGTILISRATIEELSEVLGRPRFDKYLHLAERMQFLAKLVAEAKFIEVVESVNDCRDPRDNKFLELAVSGHAAYIISGDADLLVLTPYRGISIVDPQAFLTLVAGWAKGE